MKIESDGLPSSEYLNKRFMYDDNTGLLVWQHRSADDCASESEAKRWNTSYSGKVAGSKLFTVRGSKSKIQVAMNGRVLSAHRVIWKMKNGSVPRLPIDHVDLDPFNNKWSNMRLSSSESNQWNRVEPKNNTSGFKGVTWSARMSKWKSTIRTGGAYHHLGYHTTKGLAAVAYAKASLRLHGEFSVYK